MKYPKRSQYKYAKSPYRIRNWHKRSGYSKRSMVENAIYRYKTIIGGSMRSCTLAGQGVEVQLACRVLNAMTHLGMPDSYRVG